MNLSTNIDAEKLNALIQISLLINSNYSDLNALLEKIVQSAMDVVGGDAASLLIVTADKKNLRFEIALGPRGIEAKKILVGLNGIAGWVVKHSKSAIINDVQNDTRFDSSVQKTTGYVTRNMLAVPMRIKTECIGVIEVLNKADNQDFTLNDLEVLELFATQTALAYQNASNYKQSQEEIIRLQDQLTQEQGYHTLIAESPIMLEKLAICKRIAVSDASVLILGESGVGKELIAEQIHLNSDRAGEPFIRVNCAALPEGLLESELFGHVRGAFTDAVADRKGRFETANKGTIFLDEIGEVPLFVQAKLLRVLQDKTFEPVGSSKTFVADVRIIAATNRNIEKLVEEGTFRADLYYRLNVLPIYIPPLRQRIEDIPALANFFLKKFNKAVKKDFAGFTETAMSAMLAYHWPGNIREFENAVERACVVGTPPYITEDALFFTTNKTFVENPEDKTLKTAINVFKKQYILSVLEKNNWNQTSTAEVLDIQRTYLSRLLKELDIKEK
ncbi:sigma-54-dependent Fis family transcriptional regulator [Treponema phagedenis]|uniref:sigma-54-dependent Fis family transcriptional regulator n=1 Tax=Treponema phagedenis TaxID=162 RepID=UPI0001F63FEB|nr:sigma 54-interacting transcriptional regulator [Treponema phagedenis]EFW37108.1 Sigma-54 interaction domain protein [Treponema phagedenis F0421]TYT79608.1 GAF domain-containing protein [Treponema phagedenis]